MNDIEVDGLSKMFGGFCAVDAVRFNVAHGEVFGLLGPNGAGKSTLIRMLTTLVPPAPARPAWGATISSGSPTPSGAR